MYVSELIYLYTDARLKVSHIHLDLRRMPKLWFGMINNLFNYPPVLFFFVFVKFQSIA